MVRPRVVLETVAVASTNTSWRTTKPLRGEVSTREEAQ